MDEKTFNIIEKIANEHSRVDKNRPFGYLTKDDLKNEIWVICLEKLNDFDYSRGNLENFLRVTVHNRLVNKFKLITRSILKPCLKCPFNNPAKEIHCEKFGEEKNLCDKWNKYITTTNSRNSLLNSQEEQIQQGHNESSIDKMSGEEIKQYILSKLPENYIRDFNEFSSNGKLSKKKIRKLKLEIQKILYSPKADLDFVNLTVKGV